MQFLCNIMQWNAKSASFMGNLHVYKLSNVDIYAPPPLKKEGHIALHMSVGMSVGRYVGIP